MIRAPLLLLVAFCSTSVAAQDWAVGRWTGTAENDGHSTPIVFSIDEHDGKLGGGLSFPEYMIVGQPLELVEISGDRIVLETEPGRNESHVEGVRDGDAISGTWTCNGVESSFRVTRDEDPLPYTREAVSWQNGDITLAGELWLPKGQGPHPALVQYHGSGDNERWRYYDWAQLFAGNGVAFLVWDKRGNGQSGGDWQLAGFEEYARDGIAGIDKIKQRDDIDGEQIGVIGISQAGWVMPLAASLSEDIAFIVALSAPAVTVEQEGYYDYIVTLRDEGYDEDVIETAMSILKLDAQITRTGEGFDELMALRKKYRREPWARDLGFTPAPLGSVQRNWYAKVIDYDPKPILDTLDIPILWLYGADDKSVDAEHNLKFVRKIEEDFGKDYTIRIFPQADHGLRVPKSPDDPFPFRRHADGFAEAMLSWVDERTVTAAE